MVWLDGVQGPGSPAPRYHLDQGGEWVITMFRRHAIELQTRVRKDFTVIDRTYKVG